MNKFIAFLRAINVGGRNIKMAELKKLFQELGFTSVETFIASGNVIFQSKENNRKALQQQIEDHLFECLGYPVATFLRTPEEVDTIARYMPFSEAELKSARAFSVGFLAEPLSEEAELRLMELRTDMDRFHAKGCEIYWLSAVKQNESKFSNAVFEKKLGAKATFRGIKTLTRLAAKYPATNAV